MRINQTDMSGYSFRAVKIENVKESDIQYKIKPLGLDLKILEDMRIYFVKFSSSGLYGDLFFFGQNYKKESEALDLLNQALKGLYNIRLTKFVKIDKQDELDGIDELSRNLKKLGIKPKNFDKSRVKEIDIYS